MTDNDNHINNDMGDLTDEQHVLELLGINPRLARIRGPEPVGGLR